MISNRYVPDNIKPILDSMPVGKAIVFGLLHEQYEPLWQACKNQYEQAPRPLALNAMHLVADANTYDILEQRVPGEFFSIGEIFRYYSRRPINPRETPKKELLSRPRVHFPIQMPALRAECLIYMLASVNSIDAAERSVVVCRRIAAWAVGQARTVDTMLGELTEINRARGASMALSRPMR